MRMNSAVAAACGVVALTALAVPAAHADEQFGDTEITGVVVNDGDPVVVGTGARTVTVEVTATDPSGLEQISARLYHGSFGAPDSSVAPAATCGPTAATTTTCTLTFTLTPGTVPATSSLAGGWSVSAYAIAPDSDAVFRDNAASFTLQRATDVTVATSPKPVKWGRTLTVTGGVTNANWATGTSVGAEAGLPATLEFRPRGSSTYCTVKTVQTASDGTLSTTVRAYTDGYYRWSYAGTTTTSAALSPAAFVNVVG
ncbi:calcium-binding protein [Streptomyces sp. NPDC002680]|uniref:calcium-binding protein n=1 Tax=Streptomyces sp. NPDC002680 TaxID=3364659 RepID=UPI0036BC9DA9